MVGFSGDRDRDAAGGADDAAGRGAGGAAGGGAAGAGGGAGGDAAGGAAATSSPEAPAVELQVVRGRPTDEEFAALSVVLQAAVEELTAADEAADAPPRPSAWRRSQRPVRRPIRHGYDAWRSFSG